jgi:GNAT superfamily N-acetyltransferase
MIRRHYITLAACTLSILMHQSYSYVSRGYILGEHRSNILINHRNSINGLFNGHKSHHTASKRGLMNVDQNDAEEPKYSYQIKKAKKKDIKEISSLCVDTFFEGKEDLDDWFQLSREKMRVARDLTNRWSVANTTYLIVEASEVKRTDMNNVTAPILVGFVEITLTSEHCFALTRDAPFREYRPKITSLVVDEKFRRQGIASLLVSACVKQSSLWSGHTELFLEVRDENEGAKIFYNKMGFRECIGARDLVDDSIKGIGLYILHDSMYASS